MWQTGFTAHSQPFSWRDGALTPLKSIPSDRTLGGHQSSVCVVKPIPEKGRTAREPRVRSRGRFLQGNSAANETRFVPFRRKRHRTAGGEKNPKRTARGHTTRLSWVLHGTVAVGSWKGVGVQAIVPIKRKGSVHIGVCNLSFYGKRCHSLT